MRLALIADAGSVNVRSWAGGLAEAGADVHLVSFVDAASGIPPAVQVHKLSPAPRGGPRASYVWGGRQARRIVESIGADVVIGYYVTGYGTTARLARHHPLVQVPVGNDVLVNRRGRPLHAVAARNLRAADLVLTWGRNLAQAASSFGVAPSKILVIPRGIELDGCGPPFGTARPGALVASRTLDAYYRHDILIRAVEQLRELDVTLTVYGDGPDRAQLVALASSLGLRERVVFLGVLEPRQLRQELPEYAIYVSACPTDGVSASLLEAMAAGLFPIVIDNPSNREWIEHGHTGLLTDTSPEAFAAAIRLAVASPELLHRAQELNWRTLEQQGDLQKNVSRHIAVLKKLAKSEHER